MVTERLKRQNDRLLDEAENGDGDLNWRVVRDRALAVLAFDPDNADAYAFLSAAERAIGVQPSFRPPVGLEVPLARASSDIRPVPESQFTVSFFGGRYQVIRLLGEGRNREVYLATDTLQKREVAFSLFKSEGEDDVSRNRRDAAAMGVMGSHPHIVTIYHIGEHNGHPFMAAEVMEGGDLERALEDAPGHRLPLEQAINITRDICRGLEFAHSRGIVHGDLKPGNVWLTGDGTAKVGDFGLDVDVARAALMVGSVSYMPPEKATGKGATARSDLYSLGAVLYEMVTGRPPFPGDDSAAIIVQHMNTPPVAPTWHNPDCPLPLEELILRLLAKDPDERPESATAVLAALDAIDITDIETPLSSPLGNRGQRGVDDASASANLPGGAIVGQQREMKELKAALEDALSLLKVIWHVVLPG